MTVQKTVRMLKMEMLGDSEQMRYAKQIAIKALEKHLKSRYRKSQQLTKSMFPKSK